MFLSHVKVYRNIIEIQVDWNKTALPYYVDAN